MRSRTARFMSSYLGMSKFLDEKPSTCGQSQNKLNINHRESDFPYCIVFLYEIEFPTYF